MIICNHNTQKMICILVCDGCNGENIDNLKKWLSKLDNVKCIFPSSLPNYSNMIKVLCIPDGNPSLIAASLRNTIKHIITYIESGGIVIASGGGSHALDLISSKNGKISLPYKKSQIITDQKYNYNTMFFFSRYIYPLQHQEKILTSNDLNICEWCMSGETMNHDDIAYDQNIYVYLSTRDTPLCVFKYMNNNSGGIMHLHALSNNYSDACFNKILNDISLFAYGKRIKKSKL